MVLRFENLSEVPEHLRPQVIDALESQKSGHKNKKTINTIDKESNAVKNAKEGHAKYRNKRTVYNGVTYDSKHEANYAFILDEQLKAGEILWWCRQPEFILSGGIKYRPDFIICWAGGEVDVIDVKGFKTKEYKLKKRLVESQYKVEIKEVK